MAGQRQAHRAPRGGPDHFAWEVLAHLYLKRAWVQETAFGAADEHVAFLAGCLA